MPPQRNSKGQFVKKGSEGPVGAGLKRDKSGRLRDASGRFVKIADQDTGYQSLKLTVARLKRDKAAFMNVGLFTAELAVPAAANELGTARVRERPAWRNAFDRDTKKLTAMIRRDAGRMIDGRPLTPQEILTPAAVAMRSSIIESIINLRSPANKQSTIDQKGSSNPLVDTGETQRAIEFRPGTASEAE
jgi:hypothetical protein